MLVITRSEGQEVVIGNPAAPLGIVRVDKISEGKVRMVFDFSREMHINRAEVAEIVIREHQKKHIAS